MFSHSSSAGVSSIAVRGATRSPQDKVNDLGSNPTTGYSKQAAVGSFFAGRGVGWSGVGGSGSRLVGLCDLPGEWLSAKGKAFDLRDVQGK